MFQSVSYSKTLDLESRADFLVEDNNQNMECEFLNSTIICDGWNDEIYEMISVTCNTEIGLNISWDSCSDATIDSSGESLIISEISGLVTVKYTDGIENSTEYFETSYLESNQHYLIGGRFTPFSSAGYTINVESSEISVTGIARTDGYFTHFLNYQGFDSAPTISLLNNEGELLILKTLNLGWNWLGNHSALIVDESQHFLSSSTLINMPLRSHLVDCGVDISTPSEQSDWMPNGCYWEQQFITNSSDEFDNVDVKGVIEYFLTGGLMKREVNGDLTMNQLLRGGFGRDFQAISSAPIVDAFSDAWGFWQTDVPEQDENGLEVVLIPLTAGLEFAGEWQDHEFRDRGSTVAVNKDEWCVTVHKDREFLGEFSAYYRNLPILEWGALSWLEIIDRNSGDVLTRIRPYVPISNDEDNGRTNSKSTTENYLCNDDGWCLNVAEGNDWRFVEASGSFLITGEAQFRHDDDPSGEFTTILTELHLYPQGADENPDGGKMSIHILVMNALADNYYLGIGAVLEIDVPVTSSYDYSIGDYFYQESTQLAHTNSDDYIDPLGSSQQGEILSTLSISPREECTVTWEKGSTESGDTFQAILIRDRDGPGLFSDTRTYELTANSANVDTLLTISFAQSMSFGQVPGLFNINSELSDIDNSEDMGRDIDNTGVDVILSFSDIQTFTSKTGFYFDVNYLITDTSFEQTYPDLSSECFESIEQISSESVLENPMAEYLNDL